MCLLLCCNTLQHTASQCDILQHTATRCNTLHNTATHSNTLQHTATHCNTLQHTATQYNLLCCALSSHNSTLQHTLSQRHTATHYNLLCHALSSHSNTQQHTASLSATHCNTLQHSITCNFAPCRRTTTHCSTLQHTIICCSAPCRLCVARVNDFLVSPAYKESFHLEFACCNEVLQGLFCILSGLSCTQRGKMNFVRSLLHTNGPLIHGKCNRPHKNEKPSERVRASTCARASEKLQR